MQLREEAECLVFQPPVLPYLAFPLLLVLVALVLALVALVLVLVLVLVLGLVEVLVSLVAFFLFVCIRSSPSERMVQKTWTDWAGAESRPNLTEASVCCINIQPLCERCDRRSVIIHDDHHHLSKTGPEGWADTSYRSILYLTCKALPTTLCMGIGHKPNEHYGRHLYLATHRSASPPGARGGQEGA